MYGRTVVNVERSLASIMFFIGLACIIDNTSITIGYLSTVHTKDKH